jgi:hypothetical protein
VNKSQCNYKGRKAKRNGRIGGRTDVARREVISRWRVRQGLVARVIVLRKMGFSRETVSLSRMTLNLKSTSKALSCA